MTNPPTPTLQTVSHDGQQYVQLSVLLAEASLKDAGTANTYCDELGIERCQLPGQDGKVKFILVSEIPRLFGRYKRNIPEMDKILSGLLGTPPPDNTPDKIPGKRPDKKPQQADKIPGMQWWDSWGISLGDLLGSPLTAYLGMIALVVAQTYIHVSGIERTFQGSLPRDQTFAAVLLMQAVILLGTVNSKRFFGSSGGYEYAAFIAVFFIYDLVMSGCNFFFGYDASDEPITGLGFRVALTIGFPSATAFFAVLVKRFQ